MRRAAAAMAAAAAAIGSTGATAHAAAGDLDPSFSSDGKVSLLSAGAFVARTVAIQPDGRLLVGGSSCDQSTATDNDATCRTDGDSSFRLARFTTDGGLDGEFGDRGVVTTPLYGSRSQIYDLLTRPSGEILAAGVARGGGGDKMALARYDARGALTNSTAFPSVAQFSIIQDLAPGPGNTVYATGQINDAGLGDGHLFVARLVVPDDPTADVQLDTSFNGTGWVAAPWAYGYGLGLVPTADGGVVAAGIAGVSAQIADAAQNRFGLLKLDAGGAFDLSFGGSGLIEQPLGTTGSFANAATGTPTGWVAVGAATSDSAGVMAAVGASGAAAPAWQRLVPGPADAVATDVATAPDGKMVLAGQVLAGAFGSSFGVARLNADGAVDGAFGGGFSTIEFERFARATAVAVQSDGRTVTAGIGCAGAADNKCTGGTAVLLLARQLADPPPVVVTPTPTPTPIPTPTPVARDTKKPTGRLTGVPKRVTRSTLRGKGLKLRVRASEPVRLDLRLNGSRRSSRRRTVALDHVVLRRLRRDVTVRVRAGRRALRRTRAGTLTLRMRLTDAAGNSRTLTARLKLR